MWGENLAWGWPANSLADFINQSWGHGEYQRLLASNGARAAGNGHLWSLLSPENYGYGFSHVTTKGGEYPVAAATAISNRKQPRQDRSLNQRITRTLYRPAAMHETPTGLERITLREGTALPIQHTAGLWGGTSHEWVAPEVKEDTETYAQLTGTYPDGTTTTERIPVLILNKDADKVTPTFSQPEPVREGLEVTAKLTNGHEIPRGTRIEPNQGARIAQDGTVTWRTPSVDKDQDLKITVTFTYPDKSSNTATITVPVRDSLSDQHEPAKLNKQFEVREGQKTTIDLAPIIAGLPEGTKVSSTSGQVSGTTLTYTGESVNADTVLDVPIIVTYPDESTDTTSVSVLVTDQQSDQFKVTYPSTTVNENGTATISPEFSQPLPSGTRFSLADDRAGVSIDSTTGEVTYTVGELNGNDRVTLPIDVTYPDKSTSRVSATVQLNDLTPPANAGSSGAGGIIGGLVAAIAVLSALVGLAQQLNRPEFSGE